MSDVSKTIPELIEEARGFWGSETREYTEGLVSRLADALEAANMLREPGDAALAAIARVRALETFSITDSYPAWTAVDHDDLLAALDGAPEPGVKP